MKAVDRSGCGLRALAAPFVVVAPVGARTRTRLRLTADEQRQLERVGDFLGGLYRCTLASRIRLGKVSGKDEAAWRAETKRALTGLSSSRWAGAITRTAIDQFNLGMRSTVEEIRDLREAITTIDARVAVPAGEVWRNPDRPKANPVRGYERFAKTRRRAALADRLARAEARLACGCPRIVVGGGRLWRARQNLDAAELTVAKWQDMWRDRRLFLTADGETGKAGGNETIRVGADRVARVKVPSALAGELGTHLTFARALSLDTHRGDEWAQRINANQAVRYDLWRDRRGRWYVDASWAYPQTAAVPDLAHLQGMPTLGVDLNAGHVDAAVVDEHGNVVGTPRRLDVELTGPATMRDGQLRHTITRLIHLAKANGCASITIENLGFTQARSTGREMMGRGQRGKRFRRTVAGLPTAKFRDRLAAMTATAALALIVVDPAYTSRGAREHWLTPLQANDPTVDGHRAAAVTIGRRGLGHRARRKPIGPCARQRTRAGQPVGQSVTVPRPRRAPAPASRTHTMRQARGTTKPGAPPPTPFGRQSQRTQVPTHQER